jgi:hypothetical protein
MILPGLIALLVFLPACSGPQSTEEAPSVDPERSTGVGPGLPEVVEETAAVTEVAVTFLAALSGADTATLANLLAPGAMIYSVRDGSGEPSLGAVTRAAFLESLGGEDQALLERMWDPTVQVQGRVAMVWTPYDFHLNGEFSHCGIDVFSMLKGPGGWQVTSITYNVVREGCTPSPLGPPGGDNT